MASPLQYAAHSYQVRSGAAAMATVTVSDKGPVVIPTAIRQRLGIEPGTRLDSELEVDTIRVSPVRGVKRTRPEDGYGMLRCDQPGERRLSDFAVATARRGSGNDRLVLHARLAPQELQCET
jgi:antitoxin PrlF